MLFLLLSLCFYSSRGQALLPQNVTDSISSLCSEMLGMPGCSLSKICSSSGASSEYCKPLDILSTICQDMPKMSGCTAYVQACSASMNNCGSIIPIPSSKKVTQDIYGICSSMAMDGCSTCQITSSSTYSECPLMETYSKLCQAMPEMPQCSDWKSTCVNTQNVFVEWCGSADQNPDAPPAMQMYFHSGISDYLLFHFWVPRSTGQYVGSLFAILCLGILYEGLLSFFIVMECNWTFQSRSKSTDGSTIFTPSLQSTIGLGCIRGLMKFLSVSIAYLLMLVAMTFNIGMFLAAVGGIAIGHALFVPYSKAAQLNNCPIDLDFSAQCC